MSPIYIRDESCLLYTYLQLKSSLHDDFSKRSHDLKRKVPTWFNIDKNYQGNPKTLNPKP